MNIFWASVWDAFATSCKRTSRPGPNLDQGRTFGPPLEPRHLWLELCFQARSWRGRRGVWCPWSRTTWQPWPTPIPLGFQESRQKGRDKKVKTPVGKWEKLRHTQRFLGTNGGEIKPLRQAQAAVDSNLLRVPAAVSEAAAHQTRWPHPEPGFKILLVEVSSPNTLGTQVKLVFFFLLFGRSRKKSKVTEHKFQKAATNPAIASEEAPRPSGLRSPWNEHRPQSILGSVVGSAAAGPGRWTHTEAPYPWDSSLLFSTS